MYHAWEESIGCAGPDRHTDFEVLWHAPAEQLERGRRCCCETWSCKASFFDSMQPADLQLQSDEPLMLLSFPQASKQRRSASVVAHLLLLHGEAEEIRVRLCYTCARLSINFTTTLARRGVTSAIYESSREPVWIAKHTTLGPALPACLQPYPRLSE